mmetsp:Transcript_21021/g.58310  ORF Transcript_21021/g.58310 Transcript_21021/m.58310 type:complete len:232 (-) Transcript_21021:553-1248(-)
MIPALRARYLRTTRLKASIRSEGAGRSLSCTNSCTCCSRVLFWGRSDSIGLPLGQLSPSPVLPGSCGVAMAMAVAASGSLPCGRLALASPALSVPAAPLQASSPRSPQTLDTSPMPSMPAGPVAEAAGAERLPVAWDTCASTTSTPLSPQDAGREADTLSVTTSCTPESPGVGPPACSPMPSCPGRLRLPEPAPEMEALPLLAARLPEQLQAGAFSPSPSASSSVGLLYSS